MKTRTEVVEEILSLNNLLARTRARLEPKLKLMKEAELFKLAKSLGIDLASKKVRS